METPGILKNKIYLYLTEFFSGMAIQLIADELAVYKEMYREEGLDGVLDNLL